ncbi:hypothetical protein FSP39_024745 [Pinctada imbricata]|uniref:Uncharacterized protein n=1 Tax=Pinctada imbricata TaxID=66713 RepID=A0AA89C795_PINIB|nr:hypothetical protein FSP39_024745 [Pinctada imbricata]
MARHDYLTNLSYFWYDFANKKVGYEEMIRNRREVDKFLEEVNNVQLEGSIINKLISGSRAEGFRFKTSDLDLMLVYKTIKVKLENDVTHDQIDDNTVLIMETDKTRPGFCMLRLDSCSHRENVCDLCALYRNSKYLSSALWRNEKKHSEEMWIHGPYVSRKNGNLEIDYAHCLQSTKWPRQALSCILRMVKAGWPSIDILTGIVQNGCHLVPIGNKVSDKEVLEWRISFSVAEKTLIHQINHCQFLCYGMLKIFLKEVIDKTPETNGLICSYFLKTAVFWEIVHNTKLWEMKDFLKWVWICFRRLLSWVKEGYCPNFFIPENNMFLGKIYGRSQRVLLHHLTILYMEGYRCLPVCRCNPCLSIFRLSHFIQFPVSESVCKKWTADFDIMDEIFTSWSC